MSRRLLLSSLLALLHAAAACIDDSDAVVSQPTIIVDPPPVSASVVASATAPPAEGSVLAFHEIDDAIDPFSEIASDASNLPDGVRSTIEQPVDERRWYFIVDDAPEARSRVEQATRALSTMLPAGRELGWEHVRRYDEPGFYRSYVLGRRFVTEKNVTAAAVEVHAYGLYVRVDLDEAGAKAVAASTRRLVDRRMAVVAFGDVVSAPLVKGEISGHSSIISMDRGRGREAAEEAAEKLVTALKR